MKELFGMKLFESELATEGTMVAVDTQALTHETLKEAMRSLDMHSMPWNYEKCPKGYKPKIRIQKFSWMTDQFERDQNNWLIDMFGIEEDKDFTFQIRPRFDMGFANPRDMARLMAFS